MKTYTPEIEEFHVGFEYEFHGMTTGGFAIMDFKNNTIEQMSDPDIKIWDKCKVSTNPMFKRSLDSIENSIVSGQIRVKYLDQSDIESLGFVCTKTDKHNPYGLVNEYFKSNSYGGLTLRHYPDTYHIGLNDGNELFSGKIKNKSELRRVLKMVGYDTQ